LLAPVAHRRLRDKHGAALHREQRGGQLRVVLDSEKRIAKRLWPQRREDRGVFRRWVAHVGAMRAGVERVADGAQASGAWRRRGGR
jgi:hypothetical protein